VLVPDLPGTPPSSRPAAALDIDGSADVLAAWMEGLGLPPAILLGNSIGCQVVAACAVRHPDRVAACVLAAPTMDPAARRAGAQLLRWVRNLPGERLTKAPLFARDYLAFGPRRLVATLRHALADHIEERLPLLAVPTLVLVGERDPIVPRPWAERAARLLPHGRLAVLAGAPHAAPFAAPDAVAAAVLRFLADVGLSDPVPVRSGAAPAGPGSAPAGPRG
jgi:pimeloyl-ACP methyl ester carboxylesterase